MKTFGINDKVNILALVNPERAAGLRQELITFLSSQKVVDGGLARIAIGGSDVKLPKAVAEWLAAFEQRVDSGLLLAVATPPTVTRAEREAISKLFVKEPARGPDDDGRLSKGPSLTPEARQLFTNFLSAAFPKPPNT